MSQEKNRADFSVDEDGTRWFHTGDIGRVHSAKTQRLGSEATCASKRPSSADG